MAILILFGISIPFGKRWIFYVLRIFVVYIQNKNPYNVLLLVKFQIIDPVIHNVNRTKYVDQYYTEECIHQKTENQ